MGYLLAGSSGPVISCIPVREVHQVAPVAEHSQVEHDQEEHKGAPAWEPARRVVL